MIYLVVAFAMSGALMLAVGVGFILGAELEARRYKRWLSQPGRTKAPTARGTPAATRASGPGVAR